MRMPIASILSYLSSGMNEDTILEAWPELEREDIRQALGYAAWAMEERVVITQNEILAEHERTEGAP